VREDKITMTREQALHEAEQSLKIAQVDSMSDDTRAADANTQQANAWLALAALLPAAGDRP
jgi:hypothetical protein